SLNQGSSNRNTAHAHKVPTVPGANRGSPEPAPSAMKRAGWASAKAQVGRWRVAVGKGVASIEASVIGALSVACLTAVSRFNQSDRSRAQPPDDVDRRPAPPTDRVVP